MIQPLVRGSNQAYAALVCSVLALIYPCVLPLGTVGLVLARLEKQRIDRGEAPEAGRGLVKAATICGTITTVLMVGGGVVVGALWLLRH